MYNPKQMEIHVTKEDKELMEEFLKIVKKRYMTNSYITCGNVIYVSIN